VGADFLLFLRSNSGMLIKHLAGEAAKRHRERERERERVDCYIGLCRLNNISGKLIICLDLGLFRLNNKKLQNFLLLS
jgi:hypothetical protein